MPPPTPYSANSPITRLINKAQISWWLPGVSNVTFGRDKLISAAMNFAETGKNPIEVFEEAMNNIMPVLEVKAKRLGGATYQVPFEVKPDRKQALGLRWLTQFSRKRGEKTQKERLAKEIIDASNNIGGAVKKREEVHRMAEANKAFASYRF